MRVSSAEQLLLDLPSHLTAKGEISPAMEQDGSFRLRKHCAPAPRERESWRTGAVCGAEWLTRVAWRELS